MAELTNRLERERDQQFGRLMYRWQAVNHCLKSFDERQREIFLARYGGGDVSFVALGIKFGVTRERIRCVVERVESKLKMMLMPNESK